MNPPNFGVKGERLADIDLREMFRKVWRRKGALIGTTVLGTLVAALIILQMPAKFTATATVMIDPRENRVTSTEAVLSGITADQATLESEIEVLRSRRLAERVIQKLSLYDRPEYNARLLPTSSWQKFTNMLSVRSLLPDFLLGWLGIAPSARPLTEEQSMDRERIRLVDS
ncbi:unnamed protein product, partial [Laminaria digitata]